MVTKIYGFNPIVYFVCKEFDIPFEAAPVSLSTGEHKSPEWLETMQPFGQVPVLVEDDGFKIFESRAIARYLVRKYRPESSFVPSTDDVRKYALFEQAMSVEAFNFTSLLAGIIHETNTKLNDASAREERIAEHMKKLGEKLDGYERILSKQKYLAGNDFTLADISHLYYCNALAKFTGMHVLVDDDPRLSVGRWYKEMTSRPAWKDVDAQFDAYVASAKAAMAEAQKAQAN